MTLSRLRNLLRDPSLPLGQLYCAPSCALIISSGFSANDLRRQQYQREAATAMTVTITDNCHPIYK